MREYHVRISVAHRRVVKVEHSVNITRIGDLVVAVELGRLDPWGMLVVRRMGL